MIESNIFECTSTQKEVKYLYKDFCNIVGVLIGLFVEIRNAKDNLKLAQYLTPSLFNLNHY